MSDRIKDIFPYAEEQCLRCPNLLRIALDEGYIPEAEKAEIALKITSNTEVGKNCEDPSIEELRPGGYARPPVLRVYCGIEQIGNS